MNASLENQKNSQLKARDSRVDLLFGISALCSELRPCLMRSERVTCLLDAQCVIHILAVLIQADVIARDMQF